MSNIVYPDGNATVTVAANGSLAVYTRGVASVFQNLTFANQPPSRSLLGTVTNGQTVFGPYSAGANITIEAGYAQVEYETGVSPQTDTMANTQKQPAPTAVNTTGPVTAAALLGGIVTSSTAAAVAGTIPTGTVLDAATELAIGDGFTWSVINTGPNTFTVTADTDHTIVGAAAVATGTSGLFRTRKSAAHTYITNRIS